MIFRFFLTLLIVVPLVFSPAPSQAKNPTDEALEECAAIVAGRLSYNENFLQDVDSLPPREGPVDLTIKSYPQLLRFFSLPGHRNKIQEDLAFLREIQEYLDIGLLSTTIATEKQKIVENLYFFLITNARYSKTPLSKKQRKAGSFLLSETPAVSTMTHVIRPVLSSSAKDVLDSVTRQADDRTITVGISFSPFDRAMTKLTAANARLLEKTLRGHELTRMDQPVFAGYVTEADKAFTALLNEKEGFNRTSALLLDKLRSSQKRLSQKHKLYTLILATAKRHVDLMQDLKRLKAIQKQFEEAIVYFDKSKRELYERKIAAASNHKKKRQGGSTPLDPTDTLSSSQLSAAAHDEITSVSHRSPLTTTEEVQKTKDASTDSLNSAASAKTRDLDAAAAGKPIPFRNKATSRGGYIAVTDGGSGGGGGNGYISPLKQTPSYENDTVLPAESDFDERELQQRQASLKRLLELVRETKTASILKYGKLFQELKKSLKNYEFRMTKKERSSAVQIRFRSPVNDLPIIIFFDEPHGSQLKKAWPAWRHNFRRAFERAGLV